jgi:inner membrane protein COX18
MAGGERIVSTRAISQAVQGVYPSRTYSSLLSQRTLALHTILGGSVTPSLPSPARSLSSNSTFYSVIHSAENSFQAVHSFTHLPWWGVVITVTVVLRSVLTLPLAIHQNRVIAKMELLLPTLKEYQEAVKHNVIVKCRRANLPVEEANRQLKKAAKEVARDLYSQEGCNPYRVAILPWVQLPLWITLSFALRNMAGVFPGVPSNDAVKTTLVSEGCLWFPDLTVPDPYYILPILLVGTNLCNIELHALRRQSPSRTQRIFTNSLRVLSVGMLLVATQMPAVS